jgi:CRP-like cAMP-binding protein
MPGKFIANLERGDRLTDAEREAVEGLLAARRVVPPGGEVVVEGDAASEVRVLLQGQAFRHRTLADGRRQIMAFHAPGDVLDLQGLLLKLDYSVSALTLCQVATVPRARFEAMLDSHPRLARAFWRLSLAEGAIQREWMVGMGRRSALARIAHLLCEVFLRLKAVGLAERDRCHFPVTQAHLADALGLSAVHTNRVLQALRAAGLIAYRNGDLHVLDWDGLRAAGEFDAAYLNLPQAAIA